VSPVRAVEDFLRRLSRPAHVLVAVSGGSDSTGLLVALSERLNAADAPGLRISAATIDHGLRPDAAAEAQEVHALCARLGVDHVSRRWDDEKPVTGIMAAAREARYGLLAAIAAEIAATVVVTAHTFDDQRETLLMRAARREAETGRGIAHAVLFDRRIWVVRPLLHCRRADIRRYLESRQIGWVDDPSNEDDHYERVRVRRQLAALPHAPDVRSSGDDDARMALSAAAAAWFDRHGHVESLVVCHINAEGLAADTGLLAYALGYLIAVFGGKPFVPGHSQMERVLAFLAERTPGRMTVGRAVLDLRKTALFITRELRGIGSMPLAAGKGRIWDGRFEIVNHGAGALIVAPSGAGLAASVDETLPKGVARRAGATLPRILRADGPADPEAISIVPYLAPFDRFLTRFDVIFADRWAQAFGRNPYLCLPL
jgi:tRNA(Ile)-lysidine synthase